MKKRIGGFLLVMVLVLLDQLTKLAAVNHLMGHSAYPVIPGVFEFQYVENTGGAFSLFSGGVQVFAVMTLLLILLLGWFYLKMPLTRRYTAYRFLVLALMAGGIGNLIDRVFRGYVVDFLYFKLINFPVFNLADCYVTVSLAVFAIYYLTRKDDALSDLFKKTGQGDSTQGPPESEG